MSCMGELSKTRWSRGVTKDGYHVRAGCTLRSTEPDWVGGYEVVGVDEEGRACVRGYTVLVCLNLKPFRTVEEVG